VAAKGTEKCICKECKNCLAISCEGCENPSTIIFACVVCPPSMTTLPLANAN